MQRNNTVAIAEIDTRRLTRVLRERGAQHGCLMTASDGVAISDTDKAKAIELAQGFAGLTGMDLAKECCHQHGFEWTQGTWQLADNPTNIANYGKTDSPTGGFFTQLETQIPKRFHVVAYDFGTKTNICLLYTSPSPRD